MKLVDWLLLAGVAALVAGAVTVLVKTRKKGGCSCGCGCGCDGCKGCKGKEPEVRSPKS